MKLFKDYFIPHEENDHQPHILRSKAVLFIGLVIIGIEALFLLQTFVVLPRIKFAALVLPTVLVDETNQDRVTDHLAMLTPNLLLQGAAQAKANDMAAKGYFAHTSPDGKTPWYWFGQVGYQFSYAGENLAVNFTDSQDVINAWMNSPGHRANILNGDFTEIGIATAQGTYEGQPAVFVVQLFGTPLADYLATLNAPPAKVSGSTPTAVSKVTPKPAPIVLAQNPPAAPPLHQGSEGQAPAPVVIKEASTTTPLGNDLFVAVKSASIANQNVSTSVAATEVQTQPSTELQVSLPAAVNPIASAFASPREAVNYILYFLGALLAVALLLNIFIKLEVQHKQLILNGLMLLVLVTTIIFANQYLSISHIRIL